MSADPLRVIRVAAREEHRRLSLKPRTLAVTPLGKIRLASKCNSTRHVLMGTYDKDVPLAVIIADAETAYAELLRGGNDQ